MQFRDHYRTLDLGYGECHIRRNHCRDFVLRNVICTWLSPLADTQHSCMLAISVKEWMTMRSSVGV